MERENRDTITKENKKVKKPKLKVASITILTIGAIALIAGVIFLIMRLNSGPSVSDGEYLISAEDWKLDGSDGVVWDFTEIGKGKLTTNNHLNDYDFIWSLENGKLLIETDWLYDLENSYDYELNQKDGILTLKNDGTEVKFIAGFANE